MAWPAGVEVGVDRTFAAAAGADLADVAAVASGAADLLRVGADEHAAAAARARERVIRALIARVQEGARGAIAATQLN